MSQFDRAFGKIIGHEGGYVNNPNDPGGETKYGISQRAYPNEIIANITLERAKDIYRRDYWDPVHGDDLPWDVAVNLFDGAVNSGVRQSIQWMQRAADVADDGIIGPITLGAWRSKDPRALAARFNGERLRFMAALSGWSHFSRGWARRLAANLREVGHG